MQKNNSQEHFISTGNEIEQTGAAIRGTTSENGRKTWATLPKATVVESTRRLIGSGSTCKVSALDVIKCETKQQLISTFSRTCGLIGDVNVFLSEDNTDGGKLINDHTNTGLSNKCSKAECEEALQLIMKDRASVVEASVRLLQIMNDAMISKARRMLAECLENAGEATVWYCWTQYIGVELDTLTENQQQLAVKNMSKWWTFMTKIYDKLAMILLDVERNGEQVLDLEVGLKEWRDLTSIIRGATSHEEVFHKERIIYKNYQLEKVPGFHWSKRRDLLNKLIERKELDLHQILDLRRVELTLAADYEEWLSYAKTIFRLAEAKNIGMLSNKRINWEEQKKPNILPPSQPKRYEASSSGPYDKPTKSSCYYCKQEGHWRDQCPSKNKLVPGFASQAPKVVDEPKYTKVEGNHNDDKVPYYQTQSG